MSAPTIWTGLRGVAHRLRFVQVGPWRTRVLEAGEAADGAQTMVLMHGTGGHLEAYARNIAAFAARHRVLAYDYPGHGHSTLATADLELADYVAHLDGLLDACRLDRVHLNGESLGGAVAVKYAAAHPDRVANVVLNTPGGTMADPAAMERLRVLSQAAADDPTPERIRTRLEWLMADPADVTDELLEIRRAIYARPGFATSMRHILCLQDVRIRRRNLVEDRDLAAVPGPALVLWTTGNPSGPASVGREMARKIPGGRFELIADAGHWPQWERPARFNDLVLTFLSEP